MNRETRFVPVTAGLEVRANGDGAAKGIRGTAIVYGATTNIGGWFEERIEPGAFDHALDSEEVVGLFNHNPDFVLARNRSTMSLSADKGGVQFDIPELPESRADVLEAVTRGDIRGNSFSFDLDDGEVEWVDRGSEGKIDLRIIRRGGNLYDVGPVAFPAYKQTSVSARSAALAIRRAPEEFGELTAEQFRRLLEQLVNDETEELRSEIERLVAENETLKCDLRVANLMRRPSART